MHPSSSYNSVLSFYPNTRGVGYCFFKQQDLYSNAGMITTRNRFTNERYIVRMKKLIKKHQPDVVVLEEYRTSKGSVKQQRTRELIKSIAHYTLEQDITVQLYTRQHIREVFSFFNVMKKYDISQLICHWIPDLSVYAYKKRLSYKMEPYSSAVFDAVSLAITYYYLNT